MTVVIFNSLIFFFNLSKGLDKYLDCFADIFISGISRHQITYLAKRFYDD